jgi:[protein-PII] uridylyltransferase
MLKLRTATADSATPDAIPNKRAIISRRKLATELESIAEQYGVGDALRPPLVACLKATLDVGREEIRKRFEAGGTGEDCVQQNCYLVDRLIKTLADFVVLRVFASHNPTSGEVFDIAATGGYGRGELAPFSDVDLLFLLPYKRTPKVEQVVEYLLYLLWDLGLKVGHAVRSVDECIRQSKADITIRTGILESRFLWGQDRLFSDLKRRFDRDVMAGTGVEFLEAKLAERDARHRKLGDSRYTLEPNLKDGKGGLRDLQTLFWIAKYLYRVSGVSELVDKGVLLPEEAQRFAKAQNFLWTARCHLHYLAGRLEDRLTFDMQAPIGARMGYMDRAGAKGVERFMKHYFLVAKDVGDLTRIFCATLEAESKRPPRFNLLRLAALARPKVLEGFVLDGERLNVRSDKQFREQPIDMIRLFHLSQQHDVDIHPAALKAITRSLTAIGPKLRNDPEANRLFMEILTHRSKDPEITLRRMNEAGVLAKFIPDFGRVVAQMQYDMYHVYTVDEHTLFAIGILHRIEKGELEKELPLSTEVIHKVVSRRALYVSMLLHDIAKGRGGDHSVMGARVAEKLCPRLGLTAEETETVAWLVRWHLAMSYTSFKRDLEDDKTTRDFVDLVQSPERLRLLLCLTVADIRAVGPGRWNNWKATLLREIYSRAEELMSGGLSAEGRDRRVKAAQGKLTDALKDFSAEEMSNHLALGYPAYWLAFDTDSLDHQARLIREADRAGRPLTIDTRIDRGRSVTEVTIYAMDHHGLFCRLAGALAAVGADIVDARIFTMTNGMALDVFTVQDATGGVFESGDKLARLSVMVERVLGGQVRSAQEAVAQRTRQPSRTKVFHVPPRVLIDNHASSTHTVIEVNGRDRPGLLYDLTRALTSLSLQISSAKIATYGEKAVDVFYVKDVFGLKVTHDAKLAAIKEKLLKALAEPLAFPPAIIDKADEKAAVEKAVVEKAAVEKAQKEPRKTKATDTAAE